MRVRAQSSSGDYTFGQGSQNFLVDSVEAVQQLVLTGLKLWQGEFFLNTAAGMAWATEVIGFNTQAVYDSAIQTQILGTTGVTGISSYSSTLDRATRTLSVQVSIDTAYGSTSIATTVTFAPPTSGGYGVGGYGVNPYGE